MNKRIVLGGIGVIAATAVVMVMAVMAASDDNDSADSSEQITAALNDTITYYSHIEPIITQRCAGCHVEGGIGGFALDEAQLVRDAAPDVGYTVMRGEMPPWQPGVDSPALVGDRSLPQDEIALILAWIEQGVRIGEETERTPVEIAPTPLVTIREDLILEMPVAYRPDLNMDDDYRCFLLDAELPEDRYITGYTVEPGDEAIVHHVLLFQIDESARAEAMAREAEDDIPGWQCFGGPGVRTGQGGFEGFSSPLSEGGSIAGSIGAWAPGALPVTFPEGTGARLKADGLVVMQVHYHPDDNRNADQSRVIFQLAEPGEQVQSLYAFNMAAPVEIPCPAGSDSTLCDRAAALGAAMQEDGRRAIARTTGLLAYCNRTPDDYVEQDSASVTSSCDFTIPMDSIALGTAGHMHELGVAFQLELNPDTPDARILLDLPNWDFEWQDGYWYVEPIQLSTGDVVRITCVWDNYPGERYILWGEGTGDEMCLGALTLLPQTSSDAVASLP